MQAASQALNGRAARAVTRPGPFGNPFAKRDEAAQYFIINEIKFEAWVKGDTQLEGNALLVDAFARWILSRQLELLVSRRTALAGHKWRLPRGKWPPLQRALKSAVRALHNMLSTKACGGGWW